MNNFVKAFVDHERSLPPLDGEVNPGDADIAVTQSRLDHLHRPILVRIHVTKGMAQTDDLHEVSHEEHEHVEKCRAATSICQHPPLSRVRTAGDKRRILELHPASFA